MVGVRARVVPGRTNPNAAERVFKTLRCGVCDIGEEEMEGKEATMEVDPGEERKVRKVGDPIMPSKDEREALPLQKLVQTLCCGEGTGDRALQETRSQGARCIARAAYR